MMRPQLVIEKGEVAVRLAEQKFHYHRDGPKGKGIVNIPKNLLNGFRLSEIPRDTYIHPNFTSIDIWLPSFAEGSALVLATAEWNRSSWDGDVRLTHYMEAFRQAILERKDAEEFESHEHGDSIFLHYDITISDDLEIQEAINRVENIVTAIEKRADQLAHRRSDPLTGLFDRGSFDADLTHAQEYSKADSLSLLVIDLDKFKTIKDTYGHEAGDEVLKKAAGVVRLACEGKGSCYRYGGDEVIVLLPNHNFQQATAVAEQIRVSVAELKFEK